MFNNFDLIKQELIKYPLYKQRGKQEVFLGIKNTSTNKWVGFKIIKELKSKIELFLKKEDKEELKEKFDEFIKIEENRIDFNRIPL